MTQQLAVPHLSQRAPSPSSDAPGDAAAGRTAPGDAARVGTVSHPPGVSAGSRGNRTIGRHRKMADLRGDVKRGPRCRQASLFTRLTDRINEIRHTGSTIGNIPSLLGGQSVVFDTFNMGRQYEIIFHGQLWSGPLEAVLSNPGYRCPSIVITHRLTYNMGNVKGVPLS